MARGGDSTTIGAGVNWNVDGPALGRGAELAAGGSEGVGGREFERRHTTQPVCKLGSKCSPCCSHRASDLPDSISTTSAVD
jgi:hypothetical protein